MEKIVGRGFLLGENVDTDQVLPGFAMSYPPEELKKVALCGSCIPDFAERVQPGDMILADDNFGCGSSREKHRNGSHHSKFFCKNIQEKFHKHWFACNGD